MSDREIASALQSHTNSEWAIKRYAALNAHAREIEINFSSAGSALTHSTRGRSGQSVVCLDVLEDGKPKPFRTTSEAARWAGVSRGYIIYKAIIRGSTCGGHRFAWASGRKPTPDEIDRVRRDVRTNRRQIRQHNRSAMTNTTTKSKPTNAPAPTTDLDALITAAQQRVTAIQQAIDELRKIDDRRRELVAVITGVANQ